jgi:hypothetical protein
MSRYSSLILSDNPVSYWRLGESSGTTATDEEGTNNGTYTGTVTLGVTGLVINDPNTSVSLNGNNANYIEAKNGTIVCTNTNASVEAWVNLSSIAGGQSIYCERAASGNDIWKLEVAPTPNTHKLQWTHRDDGGTLFQVHSSTTVDDSKTHHVVITKSGTAIQLYVDGLADGSGTMGGTNTLTNAGLEARIGNDKGDSTIPLNGTIDEVAVYSSALTATQVLKHFQAGLSSFLLESRRLPRLASTKLARKFRMNLAIACADAGWKNDGAGTVGPLDIVGNGRASTPSTGAVQAKDLFGNGVAIRSSTVNGDTSKFNISPGKSFKDTDPFTVICGFSPSDLSAGVCALWSGVFTGASSGVGLRIASGQPTFQIGSGSASSTSPLINIGYPNVIACTSDGTHMKVYVNGVLAGSGTVAGTSGNAQTPIHVFQDWQFGSNNAPAGDLHFLYSYTRMLTAAEVQRFQRDFFWPFRGRSGAFSLANASTDAFPAYASRHWSFRKIKKPLVYG